MSEVVCITIDGQPVDVKPGQTVLDAARKLGLDIPTLCHLEKCGPLTSCLACVVKIKSNGSEKILPSCATEATPGMVVESETNEVREARRMAMELLLSDHVGDCLSPCHRLCPLGLNIPETLRHILGDRFEEAMQLIQDTLPMPAVISRLCHAPCESGCRRSTWDQPVAIRELNRSVADSILQSRRIPQRTASDSGKKVVIVGAGPAGLAAAFSLARSGHSCVLVDRRTRPGGSLLLVDETILPRAILSAEIAQLEKLGVEFKCGVELGNPLSIQGLLLGFDAVLLAFGQISASEAKGFDLATSAQGIQINAETFQTNIAKVFAAGSAVRPIKQIVRAMSDGTAAAECIDQFLSEENVQRPDKVFSSVMGRLEKEELELFVKQASPMPSFAPAEHGYDFSAEAIKSEAARCVHCDCRAAGNCKLQHYAALYGADPGRFRSERRSFEQNLQHGGVIYEPGKCIRCGICVRLTEQAKEPLGLTFVGRGFDVKIAAPLNGSVAEALQKTAAECVDECPTGALVARKGS